MDTIIGIDFGNSFSFPCYIPSFDPEADRFAGKPVDLLPHDRNYGLPSVFFYSKKAADRCRERGTTPPPWCGTEAVSGRATPLANRIRNLKRHLQDPLTIDDWDGGYDEAIVLLIQYIVRQANAVLKSETLETTNLISLSYPASFNKAQCAYLKILAERAQLEDGRNIKVYGMIAEPAAAALDFLVENGHRDKESTVLSYDLGGGTFDLAVVSAYPRGRKRKNGTEYFFDIDSHGGLKIGGTECDERLCQLIRSRLGDQSIPEDSLVNIAINAKHELTEMQETDIEGISSTGEMFSMTITRAEFEAAVADLVDLTVQETVRMLNESLCRKPELIILTGGASQMPIIRKKLSEALPEYKDKIFMYRPSKAVAYGAARFGSAEIGSVQQRTAKDLAIRYLIDDRERMVTYIPRNSPLPFRSEDIKSHTLKDNQMASVFSVYEAKVDSPDLDDCNDYTEIMSVTMEYGPCPKGTVHESRLILDGSGILTVEAWDPGDKDKVAKNHCSIQYLIN